MQLLLSCPSLGSRCLFLREGQVQYLWLVMNPVHAWPKTRPEDQFLPFGTFLFLWLVVSLGRHCAKDKQPSLDLPLLG